MKTFTVQAMDISYLQTNVSVPDHWTEKDVLGYFQQAGIMGEFHMTSNEWKWGDITEDPSIPEKEIDSIFPED